MSIQVKSFDVYKAEEVLKTCPQIVKTYVKLLKQDTDRWKDLHYKSLSALKEKSKQLTEIQNQIKNE